MATYDKYEPIAGGFRAPLAADLTFDADGHFGPKVVSLDANGRVVVGTSGQSGAVGVVVKNVPKYPGLGNIPGQVNAAIPIGGLAGDIVDIMTHGEIVGVEGLTAGSAIYGSANGNLSSTAGEVRVGQTVEATRLVVRFSVGQPAADNG
ncbi:gp53 minor capsid family protein [Streptomyces sp. NPDC002248]